ncbi:MAG: N-acetylmuramoyl-L-alanine amidase [Nitrospirae bacterium]|nr:N-acetylmuramoyl-L-alanine amidase [Nitrospirota bacterium]
MRYLLSCMLVMIVSIAVVTPTAARPHRHNIDKGVLKEIKQARATGQYGDLTSRPADCDTPDRGSDQITQIIIHSTHVSPSMSFNEVVAHSLSTCAFAHYYIDRDGTVIRRFDDLRAARHTRSTDNVVNLSSIGIELYSTTVQERSGKPFTHKQQKALARLTAQLMNTYRINTDRVFRHADYSPLVDCTTIPESYRGDCRAYVGDHMDPYGWTDRDWGKFLNGFQPVEVTKSGTGTGNVICQGVPAIAGDGDFDDCSGIMYIPTSAGKNARVTLKARPDTGSYFTGWSGACTGKRPCKVTMNSSRTVTATFEKAEERTAMSGP